MKIRPRGLAAVYARDMVQVARTAWQQGWASGTAGNFSVASRDGVWMSPSGVCKGSLSVGGFVLLHSETGAPVREGQWKASEEAAVHLGIYEKMGFQGCVVHVHPPKIVQQTRDRSELIFESEELQKALGCVEASEKLVLQLAPNPKRREFDTLQKNLSNWWCEKSYLFIVRGHGVWAWGKTPQMAMNRIEAIEHLCTVST